MFTRRQFVAGSLATVMTPLLKGCSQPQSEPPRWEQGAYRKSEQSKVAILKATSYDNSLKDIILRAINLFPLDIKGKTIILKPNLVEYDPAGVINTHPAVIAATIDALRSLDAREVIVAEGPGHRRDNEYLLTASGLHAVLQEYRAQYVDLDNDDAQAIPVNSYFTGFPRFYFPETVLKADLLVSLPKLKTHHWAGVTLSMKNLFGLIPSAIYGWPKNILHWAGIPNSIVDINSALSIPRFAIIDGIVGMEGNGPIQGQAKHCGVLIFGDDFAAVDATATRIMTLDPRKVDYLVFADRFFGNILEENVLQLGERIETVRQDFTVIPSFRHLKSIVS